MPELPEVETIVRYLQLGERGHFAIPGRSIIDSKLLWERTLAEPSPSAFKKKIIGQTIHKVDRRGKFIQIHLSGLVLLIHLRMSGDMRIENDHKKDKELPLQPHDRLVLYLDNNLRVAFNDTRKFGRVWLVDDPLKVTGQLGPEPLDDSLTPETFHQRLHQHHRQIKPLLMDQHFLAGMGNIYTDEALFLARLHPCTPSDQLTPQQSDTLLTAIRNVLREGIQQNGSSIDWVYRGGNFQNTFKVYQRTGEACSTCSTPIERITVGQRGTHFCPVCQTLDLWNP